MVWLWKQLDGEFSMSFQIVKLELGFFEEYQVQMLYYLKVIVRKRVQYRRIVSRRGRRPSWLKSGK